MNSTLKTVFDHTNVNLSNAPAAAVGDDLVSEEFYKVARSIFAGFLLFILCLVGVLTNLLNCLVFLRQGLRDRMNLCLFSLAAVDVALPAFAFLQSSTSIVLDLALSPSSEELYFRTVQYTFGIIYAFRTTAGCYNMVIAVERCVCVMFPLHATSLMRTRTMGAILTAFVLLLQAGFIILPLRFELVRTETSGIIHWRLGPSTLLLKNQFIFDLLFYTILNSSVPLITCLVVTLATLVTVVKLKIAMTTRRELSSSGTDSQRQHTALTKVLVAVSCAYIITMLPFITYMVAQLLVPGFSPYGRYANFFLSCNSVVNVFPFINCCTGFFIYYNRSKRFRAELKSLFSFRKRKPPKGVLGKR